jgi:hypothetical protein
VLGMLRAAGRSPWFSAPATLALHQSPLFFVRRFFSDALYKLTPFFGSEDVAMRILLFARGCDHAATKKLDVNPALAAWEDSHRQGKPPLKLIRTSR